MGFEGYKFQYLTVNTVVAVQCWRDKTTVLYADCSGCSQHLPMIMLHLFIWSGNFGLVIDNKQKTVIFHPSYHTDCRLMYKPTHSEVALMPKAE